MKFKIRSQPRFRRKRLHYKFFFNNKTKVNCLQSSCSRAVINNPIRDGIFVVRFSESCQLRYFQLKTMYSMLLPYLKRHRMTVHFYANFFVSLTTKPKMRMGTGKGKFKCIVAKYYKGSPFFEFDLKITNLWALRRFLKLIRCKTPCHSYITRRLY